MKKSEIARRMARRGQVSQAEGADRLDRVVHQILSDLREGKEAPFPGLGKFLPQPDGGIVFRKAGKRHA
jgi:nucleoid DNA-binding protein